MLFISKENASHRAEGWKRKRDREAQLHPVWHTAHAARGESGVRCRSRAQVAPHGAGLPL